MSFTYETELLELDNTKRDCFRQCERKFYWQFERNLRPVNGSNALRYGIAWHAAMEAYYNLIHDQGWVSEDRLVAAAIEAAKASFEKESASRNYFEDYRTLNNLILSFARYCVHFTGDASQMNVIEAERIFKLRMEPLSAEEEKLFPGITSISGFNFTGKLDGEVMMGGMPWIIEHKTTSQPLSIQASRLHRSAQVMGYTYAAKRTCAVAPVGALITLHHLSAYKSKTTGHYGEPKIDFARSPQIFTDADIEQWRMNFFSVAERMYQEYVRDLWPMCHDSCYTYGACSYIGLCEQNRHVNDTIIDDNFIEGEPWEVAAGVEVV